MIEEPLIMDAPDVRGTNNLDLGKKQVKRLDSPNLLVDASLDSLHNSLRPSVEILTEKPIHRAMMFMFARGDTDSMVAEATSYSLQQVANVRRQPWMQERIKNELRNAGEKDVKDLLASMGPDCLQGIYDIAKDPKVKEEVKLRARQDIVDRWIGKACQPTKDETKNNLEEMSDDDLAKIAKGEK